MFWLGTACASVPSLGGDGPEATRPSAGAPSADAEAAKESDPEVDPAAFLFLAREFPAKKSTDVGPALAPPASEANAPSTVASPARASSQTPAASTQPPPRTGQQPGPLRTPQQRPATDPAIELIEPDTMLQTEMDPPLGFTGPSGLATSEQQESSHFVPVPDRWRLGWPAWDRYGRGNPWVDDIPYVQGHWWDPYNQNVIKGDYPILGRHTFFVFTGTSQTIMEQRQVPTGTTPFESGVNPQKEEFFGDPDQFLFVHNLKLSFELNHGDAAFKPLDWRIKITPIFNFNYLDVEELAVVNPDVRRGTTRARNDFSLEEWFVETKLADLSVEYDFVSLRAGSQLFTSDFRGFIFSDTNRGLRLFGTRLANRDQFNVVWFDQAEKESNSGLNRIEDRHQQVVAANYYRQDFIWPGYTAQMSIHYNHDDASFEFDENNNLVRPDPVGVFTPHEQNIVYLGWAGDGHIGRFNVDHAFYWALGRDTRNPITGKGVDVNAQMAALEVSYDRDWARLRGSVFWSSGDDDPRDDDGEGFDSIFDNPNFAGGQFSYWQRQAIKLFGVNLVQAGSLIPDLRSSKTQGQSNFVNPGLLLVNAGIDMDLTPKLRSINNVNFLWFCDTDPLSQFTFQNEIDHQIGTDLSTGIEYRPFLNNNVIITAGVSMLHAGEGFEDLYRELQSGKVSNGGNLFAGFMEFVFTY